MIRFCCENCGQKFSIPSTDAGKKGKCPKCKNVIIVPKVENTASAANQPAVDASGINSRDSILDSYLFDDIPKDDVSDKGKVLADLRKLQAGRIEPEPLPERKLPWVVDIFLYPVSKAGLTMLGIFIGVPLLIEAFTLVLNWISARFPHFIVFLSLFAGIGLIVNIVIMLYKYWYVSECIRDSGGGQIRAPETLAITPSGELLSSFLKIFVCIIIFAAPIYYYLLRSKGMERNPPSLLYFTLSFPRIAASEIGKGGIIFHLLLVPVVFLFPMAVTSVIMSDSFRGLNPILIIRSILKTFAPYCVLILLLCILSVPVVLIRDFLVKEALSGQAGFFIYLPIAVNIYLLLVAAHLLGRFYWRYQEKLDWNV